MPTPAPGTPDHYDPKAAEAPVTKTAAKFSVGNVGFMALGDRLLIEEDEFRSGYECTTCDGKRRVTCADCSGTGARQLEGGPEKRCSTCEGKGTIVCPGCDGKGALLIAPETTQRRPTTGTIVSAGDKCKSLKEGDTVLYSNFSGYVIDLNRGGVGVVMRILHETEVLALMDGHLTLANLKGKSEIATFQS